jgi:ABC-type multidrug transport system fused ATPase/permease subunit
MARDKATATHGQETAPPASAKLPSEQTLAIWFKEYDALRELYSQAEASAQSLFNFYLTLISTIGGAVIVLMQIATPVAIGQTQGIIAGLLVFIAVIGSVYLSSITGRYAHMTRYVQAIDQIRRHLLQNVQTIDLPVYKQFMDVNRAAKVNLVTRTTGWTLWLSPTGTYQLFVAAVNSLSIGIAVWLFLSTLNVAQQSPVQSIITVLVIVVVSFLIYNAYSRIVKNRLVSRLGIRLDTAGTEPFITGQH